MRPHYAVSVGLHGHVRMGFACYTPAKVRASVLELNKPNGYLLGSYVSAAVCLLLTIRRGPSDRDVPKPSAHWLALASVAIPPIAFWLQALQVFALLASALLGFVALIKVVLELTVRKQWRWRRTWLALLLCIAWPIVMKFAPCFDSDPITRRINAIGGKRCYEEMWGR